MREIKEALMVMALQTIGISADMYSGRRGEWMQTDETMIDPVVWEKRDRRTENNEGMWMSEPASGEGS